MPFDGIKTEYDPDILNRRLAQELGLQAQRQQIQSRGLQEALQAQLAPLQAQTQMAQLEKLKQALDPAYQQQQRDAELAQAVAIAKATRGLTPRAAVYREGADGRIYRANPDNPDEWIPNTIIGSQLPDGAQQLPFINSEAQIGTSLPGIQMGEIPDDVVVSETLTVPTVEQALVQNLSPGGAFIGKRTGNAATKTMNLVEADGSTHIWQVDENLNKVRDLGISKAAPSDSAKKDAPKEIGREAAENLSGAKTASDQLLKLKTTIEKNPDLFGPVQGRVNLTGAYNSRRESIKSLLRSTRQAIGKYMEGGVLRAEDERKYEEMLPKLSDLANSTDATAFGKINNVLSLLESKYANDRGAYQQAGLNVDRFAPSIAVPSYDTAEEAEAAGLPVGSQVYINGVLNEVTE